jgi:hypothetical protein
VQPDIIFSTYAKDFATVFGAFIYIAQILTVSDMLRESQIVKFLEPLQPKLWFSKGIGA